MAASIPEQPSTIAKPDVRPDDSVDFEGAEGVSRSESTGTIQMQGGGRPSPDGYGFSNPGGTAKAVQAAGIDLEGMDRTVRPQDDFYNFANGAWKETATIPPDRSRHGAFDTLREKTTQDVRGLLESIANKTHPEGSEEAKLAGLYQSFMNEAQVDALGVRPLEESLAKIDSASTTADVLSVMSELSRVGVDSPVWMYVNQDPKAPDSYILHLTQSGLGLPDRSYYLEPDFADERQAYGAHISKMLSFLPGGAPSDAADRIMAIETRLAEAQWPPEKNRDSDLTYNKVAVSDLDTGHGNIDWRGFLDGWGFSGSKEVVLAQPSYADALNEALGEFSAEDWQLYMRFKLVDEFAPYLSREVADANFEFHGKTLSGLEENESREKRAIALANASMRDAVGKKYVERHFPPEAKARVRSMVENLRDAFREAIETNDWMDPETKAKALEKLEAFTVKVGYPDSWEDYSQLAIDPEDLMGNVLRAREHVHARHASKIGQPVDRGEWHMAPQAVNAYFNPPMNEIVFPAAIAQPPFFDLNADDAANYGGLMVVIGHEFSHGFDDQGRKYNGKGELNDWWTESDAQQYTERAAKVIAQYNAFEPLPGQHINGELTQGENIADLAGARMAYLAYKKSLKGRPSKRIGGLSGEQRFFVSFAQIFRSISRSEALTEQLKTDPHSPGEYRSRGVLPNLNEFYEVFGVEEGDGMHLPPEERVQIW